MPPNSLAAHAVARRLLARAGAPPVSGGALFDPVAVAERACRHLANELSRWFGPYGYHALLTRALAQVRGTHVVLAAVRVRAPSEPCLDGLAEGAQAHGAGAMTEGVVAVLAMLIELLGRVIGEDMALNLVDQSMPTPTTAPDPADAPNAGGAP